MKGEVKREGGDDDLDDQNHDLFWILKFEILRILINKFWHAWEFKISFKII